MAEHFWNQLTRASGRPPRSVPVCPCSPALAHDHDRDHG